MTHFHQPAIEFSGQPEISIYAPAIGEAAAVIHWDGGNEHVDSEAEADEKIGIYLKTKEMLHAHRHAVACHAGLGEYVNGTAPERTICPADWGSATESQRCVGRLGHSAGHRDSDGHEWTDETRAHVMSSSPGRDEAEFPCKCGVTFRTAAAFQAHQDNALAMSPLNRPFHGWVDVPVAIAAPLPEPGPWTLKPQPATAPGEVHMACVDTAIEVPGTAQAAEVRRIGQLHADGRITDKECAGMVDKVIGEHA